VHSGLFELGVLVSTGPTFYPVGDRVLICIHAQSDVVMFEHLILGREQNVDSAYYIKLSCQVKGHTQDV